MSSGGWGRGGEGETPWRKLSAWSRISAAVPGEEGLMLCAWDWLVTRHSEERGSGGCQAGPLWPEKEGRRGRKRLFQTVIDRLLWENEHTAKPQVLGYGWGRKEGGDGGLALLLVTGILLLFHGLSYLLSSWGLIIPFLDPSWRVFIPGMHKQLPPASKIAGVNVVSPACVGLCTSPITMASSVSCLFPPFSALLCAHRTRTSPSSGLFNLHLRYWAVIQSLLPFAQGLCATCLHPQVWGESGLFILELFSGFVACTLLAWPA